jgi:hypothetical protein
MGLIEGGTPWSGRRASIQGLRLFFVELHRASATVPLRAQTQDICLGGLYVEMSFTQKVSTDLEITLWIGDTKIGSVQESE